MVDRPSTHRLLGRLTFIAVAVVLMFLNLLPLQTEPVVWAPPNILLALTLAWVARRPDLVPATTILVVYFFADLLFGRPPGLMTALVLIATEVLRARAFDLKSLPFPVEWLTVSAALTALMLANRAILAIVVSDQTPLPLTLIELVMTIVFYPVVVLLSRIMFRMSRPARGDVDGFGRPV